MKTNMFGRGCVLALVWVAAPVWFSCGKCSGRTTVVAAPITPEQVVVQVRAAVETFAKSYESRQVAALAASYAHTDDLDVSAQGKRVRGWPAVEAHLGEFFRALTEVRLRLSDVTVSVVGSDGAIATAQAHRTYGDGVKTIDEYGALTLVLRRQGDAWSIVGEHFSYAPVNE